MKEKLQKLMTNKLFKNYFLITIISFLIELTFRIVMKNPILDWAFLRIFISCNIIGLFLGLILSFTPKLASKIVTIIYTAIITIYAVVQAGFLNFLGVYLSFGTSSQLGAVKDYIADYFNSFKLIYLLMFIPLILLILYYIFIDPKLYPKPKKIKKVKKLTKKQLAVLELEKKWNKIWKIIACGILVVTVVIYYLTLNIGFMQNKIQLRSTASLFRNPSIPNLAVNQFGVTVYALIDIKTAIIPAKEIHEEEKFTKTETAINDNSRIIDDKLWNKVIENETNENLNQLNNYYITRDIAEKNEYTGLLEDKNVIIVMLESVNTLIIDPEKYPTIYKLYSKGWAWDNAYSPRNACSTGNNEMSSITSLFTINKNCTANTYDGNIYPQSLYNLFKEADYTATSYHNYNDKYYYRNLYHTNFGSEKYSDMYELGINDSKIYSYWPSDVELMEKAVPRFINDEKFFSYILTVSAHHPYANSSPIGDLYYNDFPEAPSDTLKRYLSKLKTVDKALESLLKQLEDAKKLDDTVIVLFADHYPYGLKTNDLQKLFNYNIEDRKEIDRTPFIIYNKELTPKKFSEYTTFMNITPTLANLFNLDYDPRLYAGEDILSKNYSNRAIFADGSWQDDIAYYEATTGQIQYLTQKTYTQEEILEINRNINNKIRMSNAAIELDYFNYLYNTKLAYKDEIDNKAISKK